jgi:ankyrin repeat protein
VLSDAYEKFYDKPLRHAAATCNANVASMLLNEFNADVNEINGFGRTPLFTALESTYTGGAQLVPLFLKAGASVTAADTQKRTPLHAAIDNFEEEEQKQTFRMLLAAWVLGLGSRVQAAQCPARGGGENRRP